MDGRGPMQGSAEEEGEGTGRRGAGGGTEGRGQRSGVRGEGRRRRAKGRERGVSRDGWRARGSDRSSSSMEHRRCSCVAPRTVGRNRNRGRLLEARVGGGALAIPEVVRRRAGRTAAAVGAGALRGEPTRGRSLVRWFVGSFERAFVRSASRDTRHPRHARRADAARARIKEVARTPRCRRPRRSRRRRRADRRAVCDGSRGRRRRGHLPSRRRHADDSGVRSLQIHHRQTSRKTHHRQRVVKLTTVNES